VAVAINPPRQRVVASGVGLLFRTTYLEYLPVQGKNEMESSKEREPTIELHSINA
jgi:hypothetical protein